MATWDFEGLSIDVEDWQVPILESVEEKHGDDLSDILQSELLDALGGGDIDIQLDELNLSEDQEKIIEEILKDNEDLMEEFLKTKAIEAVLDEVSPVARFFNWLFGND